MVEKDKLVALAGLLLLVFASTDMYYKFNLYDEPTFNQYVPYSLV